jgi:hypothetical protein
MVGTSDFIKGETFPDYLSVLLGLCFMELFHIGYASAPKLASYDHTYMITESKLLDS